MGYNVPKIRHLRRRSRVRHSPNLKAFDAAMETKLAVAAASVLTTGGQPTAGETVTIDGKVYTFRSVVIDVAASSILTPGGQFTDGETVTVDAKVYTFQDTLTNVDGNVKIGANEAASIANLVDAINLGAGVGVDYATAMTLHPTVSAVGDATTLTATAKTAGAAGNSIVVLSDQGTWNPASDMGGGNTAVNGDVLIGGSEEASLANLRDAINLGATAGTDYSANTTLHPTVSAASNATTLTVTDKTADDSGNDIAVLSDQGTWDPAATLDGGDGFDTIDSLKRNTSRAIFLADEQSDLA